MNPTMLYKFPGPHEIHGSNFDHTIVDEEDIENAMADGWHLTTTAAKAAHDAAKDAAKEDEEKPPTRDELEQKAHELGIEFSHNIGDAKLAERIAAALAKT